MAAPNSGSPNTELLQATPPVKLRGAVQDVRAPYTTLDVPVKLQVPFSEAHSVYPDGTEVDAVAGK